MTIQTFVLVFVLIFVLDILWVFYMKHVHLENAHRSAATSSVLYLMSATVVMQYTSDHRYVIPAVLGAYAGTYVAVQLAKKGKRAAGAPSSS